jgi:hypothetical protein
MKHPIIATVCFLFMLFVAPTSVIAVETIALHPLKGDSPNVADGYFREIVKALAEYPGPYVPYVINLEDDDTVDASSGGLPAYICPHPKLTRDAPYAITGEVIETSDSIYTIRLYLWDMTTRVVLISDELMVHSDQAEVRYLPQLLAWMLSWITRERSVAQEEKEEAEEYWLRVGLRLGGGDSSWHFNDNTLTKREHVTHLLSGNFAAQASVHILPWLAFQAEVNINIDFSPPWNTDATEGSFSSSYLTIPLLARFNWRSGNLTASLFPGVYFYLPLSRTKNDKLGGRFDYKPGQPGFFFGGSIGWKVGEGHLFVDGRFEYDGSFWKAPLPDRAFYRSTFRLSIGYEMAFLKKNKVREEPPVVSYSSANRVKVIPLPPPVIEEQYPDDDDFYGQF